MTADQPQYIEIRQNRAGQERPFLKGTRVRVQDVAIYHERFGQSADEIARNLPHLSIAQVHAALAYYFEDRAVIWECVREDEEAADELRVTLENSQEGTASDARGSTVSS